MPFSKLLNCFSCGNPLPDSPESSHTKGVPSWLGYIPERSPSFPNMSPKSRTPNAMFPLISCFILIISLLAIQAFKGYREFISLGPGGTPPNVFGYATIVFFQAFKPSKPAPDSVTGIGYLPELETRRRLPPIVAGIAPQRQTTQKAGQDVQNKLWTYLESLVPGDDWSIRESDLEEHSNGLFYRGREVAHIHPGDGSLHVFLSVPDCEVVIKSRWGGM